jgi:hypothetical protein
MQAPPDPSLQQTWREWHQLAWAILLIDLVALGLGALAARLIVTVAHEVELGLPG